MNPPPVQVPLKLQDQSDVKLFFNTLIKSNYLVWSNIITASQTTLTTSDTNTPNSGDATTDLIIANLQTRVDELEAIIIAIGQ